MKTITFKPEFEEKLQKLGVKDKYVNNVIECWSEDNMDYLLEVQYKKSWYAFISSFLWGSSPEGFDFWRNIAES